MRRELALSLVRYGYYDVLNYRPDFSSNEPVSLGGGSGQTSFPLYYVIASFPLRLLGNADFAAQNRAVRLMSLAMFLLTVLVTWKTLGELLPERHPLQWMVTLFVALLPGLADTMTSINDDVGAVLVFSLFVWASLRIMRRGFSLSRLVALGFTLLLCYWTKSTTWSAFGLAPVVLLFSLLRGRKRQLAWAMLAAGFMIAAVLSLRWGDARFWYRGAAQSESTRLRQTDAPLGQYVFHLHYQQGQTPWIGQFISVEQIRPLRDKSVTLGAWMWASEPVAVRLPILRMAIYKGDVAHSPSQTITLTTTPTFYALTFEVPFEAESGWLELIPSPSLAENEGETASLHIYYDGLVLAEGVRTGSPHFNDPSAQGGTWGGQPFQNRLRGASAELAWFWLNPVLERALNKALSGAFPIGSPDIFLASLQDWPGNKVYYKSVASTLLQTFWAQLARHKVSLPGAPASYEILQWLTALGTVGAIFLLWRKARSVPWAEMAVLGLSLAGVWGSTVARGGMELLSRSPTIPWARYAFPAIIPTALLLCAGWWESLRRLGYILKLSSWQQGALFVAFMLALDLFALLGVAVYFYWKEGQEYAFLLLITAFLLYATMASIAPRLTNGEPVD